MSSRFQRLLLWLAFLPFAILALGEVVARAWDLPGLSSSGNPVLFRAPALSGASGLLRRHPQYLWTFIPGIDIGSPASNQVIHVDNHGFRQTPWNDLRNEGFRWMFLGDSMVFCWETPDRETFPDALVNIVCKRYGIQNVASFNLGIPAHSSFQSLCILKGEFSRVNPDIVVFWGGSNDNAPANGYTDREYAMLYGGIMFHVRKMLDRSAFIRWTRTLYTPSVTTRIGRTGDRDVTYERRVNPRRFRNNVKICLDYCSERGARFLTITRERVQRPAALRAYNEMLLALAREASLCVVDINEIYADALKDSLMHDFPRDKTHFNARGYRRVAELVADRIESQQWIDELLKRKPSATRSHGIDTSKS